eukprot:scaffold233889_cov27-Tisochrysis_lutea.AAC.1
MSPSWNLGRLSCIMIISVAWPSLYVSKLWKLHCGHAPSKSRAMPGSLKVFQKLHSTGISCQEDTEGCSRWEIFMGKSALFYPSIDFAHITDQ